MLDEELLFFIAKSAMLRGTFVSSTAKISVKLGISQQSVSRKLRELQDKGLAEVSASPRGVEAKLTEKGTRLLKSRYLELKQLFEAKHLKSISGSLKTGLGEGAYYVAQAPYVKQFKELLGFKPYFGTLNLVMDEEKLLAFLSGFESIEIKGFKTKQRTFGKITAFKILIEGKEKGAIIFPERSSHPQNEIEIIAPNYLRKKLNLKEGSKVRISKL
ncbi:MAG: riboflavin kinase [Candidatus Diapherotrites archaeon]|uniref:Riboflavin kinase n=1 Tax=Candidatus Iainarchaeum sp. TaxID=3101447 RepID=A0A2D6M1M4_9ARCH|nr:riboflavin kinase [Candidatus Diapherotrites archaeon]